ncbi:hypothetical protein CPC08DRAFT_244190 [Agrocybe pediades]|nr:hypothetical protein CPC08DRAFT_244190 [Agrocybe pediades]
MKIYRHTTHSPSARKRLGHIIDSLIQSCGIYTAATLFQTILNFIMGDGVIDNPVALMLLNLNQYATILNNVTSGLIPTLMVARLAATSHRAENISTGSTSSVSLPPELKDRTDPELALIDAVPESHSPGDEVSSGSSVIVSQTRDEHSGGREEEERCM